MDSWNTQWEVVQRRQGLGFIQQDDGGPDVFVDFSAIQTTGFKELQEGDKVEYDVTQGPKGPQESKSTAGRAALASRSAGRRADCGDKTRRPRGPGHETRRVQHLQMLRNGALGHFEATGDLDRGQRVAEHAESLGQGAPRSHVRAVASTTGASAQRAEFLGWGRPAAAVPPGAGGTGL